MREEKRGRLMRLGIYIIYIYYFLHEIFLKNMLGFYKGFYKDIYLEVSNCIC